MHTNQIQPIFTNVKTIAEMTGIPVQSIRAMSRNGILPARKRGNIWMYKIEEVIEALDSLPVLKQVDNPCLTREDDAAERVPRN